MADKIGALTLPVPTTDAAIGDPGLHYLATFLAAAINARGKDAWKKLVYPNAAVGIPELPPVKAVVLSNPHEDGAFNEADLPALYAFRGEHGAEVWADDWTVDRSTITLQWIFPPAISTEQIKRSPFSNAITKIVLMAIERGREPSYVIPGDTDPRAAREGSWIYAPEYMNPVSVDFKSSRVTTMALRMSSAPMRGYPMLEVKVAMVEVAEEGLDVYAPHQSDDVSIQNEQGDEIVAGRFTI